MGSIQLPKTLAGWGRYCDCLQNFEKFKIQNPINSQQAEIQNQKAQDAHQYEIKSKQKNKIQPATTETIETPPPLKQPPKRIQKKQKNLAPLKFKKIGHQTIQQLSQYTDMVAVKDDNIFDIVRLEEDEDIKNHRLTGYVNPLDHIQDQRIRATVPYQSDNYHLENQRASNTAYISNPKYRSTKKYFIDEKDKEEYLNNLKNN